MGIGQLFMRVWRMNVSKSLGRNVSQEEMNRDSIGEAVPS